MKAVKKPVIVDFLPYDGRKIPVEKWVAGFGDNIEDKFINEPMGTLSVKTLEGTSYALVADRDVIVRGVKGEYYPCRKDIFYETYNVIQ